MIITFNSPVNVILRPQTLLSEISENIPKMEILEMTDNPIAKKVIIKIRAIGNFKFGSKYIILWEGEDYDAIGQWTDTDVVDRIKKIYGDV